MKKIFLYAAAAIFSTAMFTACSDDDNDDNQHNVPESTDVTKFNDLKFLQDALVETDSLGNFIARKYGATFNRNDTTVITIGVDSLGEAKEIFLSWLPYNVDTLNIAETLTASLTDEEGKSQGKAVFTSLNNVSQLAEVTFIDGASINAVSRVRFIHNDMWPANDISPYYVGDIATFNTAHDGPQKHLCIREAKNGKAGMMVYLSVSKGYWRRSYINEFASVSTGKVVSEILRRNWNAYVLAFKDAGLTLNDDYYWVDKTHFYGAGTGIYSIRLKDGNFEWWDIVYHSPSKRYLQIHWF